MLQGLLCTLGGFKLLQHISNLHLQDGVSALPITHTSQTETKQAGATWLSQIAACKSDTLNNQALPVLVC